MTPFIVQAQYYAHYHQKTSTFYTHLAGIPLIIFSLMILLGFFHLLVPGYMDLTLAELSTLGLILYYFRLNWRLALGITPLLLCFVWLSSLISHGGPRSFSLWFFAITMLLGLLLQLIGHMLEGKRPALVDNIWQALIAPLYLIAELIFKTGRMQDLQRQIHQELPLQPGSLN